MAMATVNLPWQVWCEAGDLVLDLPDAWVLTRCMMAGGPALDDEALRAQIQAGLDAAEIRARLAGKRSAAIAIDDITRPTPTHRLLPLLLDELAAAGIGRERVRIIVASGSHRVAVRPDLVLKLGEPLVNQVETCVHNPYEGLTYLGSTPRGTPVHTNRFFQEAELKIGVGCVLPHELGFSGGGKLIAIGLAGLTTIEALHYQQAWDRTRVGIGKMEGNECQQEFYEISEMVGLDVLVNVVINAKREAAGVFAGPLVETHHQAVALARQVYATPAPRAADIVMLNAYPKDTDLIQATMAINVAYLYNPQIVRPGGSVVVTCACPEGAGIHFLDGYGMRRGARYEQGIFGDRQLIIFSPNLSDYDVQRLFPPDTLLCRDWSQVIGALSVRHPGQPRVSIFPWASQQLPFFDGQS
jgi:nickel-dependent lactate racemase